jgi:hypothetical protein
LVGYLSRWTLHYVAPYLLLAIVAALAVLLLGALRPVTGIRPLAVPRLTVWLPRLAGGALGLGVGLLGFGNLLIGRTAAALAEPGRLWGVRILTRPVETALATPLREMFGPYEGAGPLISHLDGPFVFLARFGLVFLLVAGGLVLLRREARRAADGAAGATDLRLLTLLVFYALAFSAALFAYDFMVGHVRDQLAHWVRSRLLEPWFYGLVFVGLVGLRRHLARPAGTVVFVLLCLWQVDTMLLYPGLAVRQWTVNAAYLLRQLPGW